MASKNHLSGEQKSFTMADLRIKWGRKVGKPGLQEKMPKHNMQFSPYFTVEEKKFLDSDEKKKRFLSTTSLAMTLLPWWRRLSSSGASWRILRIWCRQGDTGQGWLKIGLNDVMKKDLEKEQGMRVAAAGTEFSMEDQQEGGPARKISTRTRKQGVGGGTQFSD